MMPETGLSVEPVIPPGRDGPRSRDDGRPPAVAVAVAVADALARSATPCGDGAVTWLVPSSHPAPSPDDVPLGPHLYDGTCGIALFFAALHRSEGRPVDRRSALAALRPLRSRLAQLAADCDRANRLRLPIGGLVGWGSFAYALARVGSWLDEPPLLAEAVALTSLLTPERIAADERLDLAGGAAGAILALLALRDTAPNQGDRLLDLASLCARHLLTRRVEADGTTLRAWPGRGTPPIGGLAHGASGIAYALLRLHRATGDPELRDAALEGLGFERHLFDRRRRTWLDPRRGEALEQVAWCHGGPGIALGRAALLADEAHPEVAATLAADLSAALSASEGFAPCALDHLCCGNAGRLEIALVLGDLAAEGGDRPEPAVATVLAEELAERAGYETLRFDPPAAPSVRSPSLFRGTAGVGWALLRAAGSTLPTPLLLS